MRLSRTVSLLLAIIMAATLSTTLASSAHALRPAPSAHAAKAAPTLAAAMTEAGNDHFIVYGVAKVTKVGIFRSVGGGNFYLYRKVKVNKNTGRFRTRVFQYKNLRTCFRVLAPQTASTPQKIVAVGCIVTVHGKKVWQPA